MSVTEDYIGRMAAGEPVATGRRQLASAERLEDALFTGLRLVEGVDMAVIGDRYGVDVWDRFGAGLEPFVAAGLLIRAGVRLRLTRAGMLVANEIMAVFV